MYLYLCFSNKHRHICIKYITKLLQLVLLPCYRIMKSDTFSKRSGAATACEFWFQLAFFNLNTGNKLEGDWGKIVALGAEISP